MKILTKTVLPDESLITLTMIIVNSTCWFQFQFYDHFISYIRLKLCNPARKTLCCFLCFRFRIYASLNTAMNVWKDENLTVLLLESIENSAAKQSNSNETRNKESHESVWTNEANKVLLICHHILLIIVKYI